MFYVVILTSQWPATTCVAIHLHQNAGDAVGGI